MYDIQYKNAMPYVVIRKDIAKKDSKLHSPENNGRKVFVTEIISRFGEFHIAMPIWHPTKKRCPVLETGCGGIEIATFSETATQECHKHLIGIEIYTVLEGKMAIRLNESKKETYILKTGDEITVLPGTPHEVIPNNTQFLTRVHSINCHGDNDKYVKVNRKWMKPPKK